MVNQIARLTRFTSETSSLGSQQSSAAAEQKSIYVKTQNQPKTAQIEHARTGTTRDRGCTEAKIQHVVEPVSFFIRRGRASVVMSEFSRIRLRGESEFSRIRLRGEIRGYRLGGSGGSRASSQGAAVPRSICKINFAIALLLSGCASGCMEVLGEIRQDQDPGIGVKRDESPKPHNQPSNLRDAG
jgi:hypothetical protein